MSELITQRPGLSDFRWRLLATVSALTLLAVTVSEAKAEDNDRSTVWIELGGQLSRLENGEEAYAPPFAALTPSNLISPLKAERPARYGFDESAVLNFQPMGSEWKFSASIRYGRSGNSKHVRQQSNPAPFNSYTSFHRSAYGSYFHFKHYNQVNALAARFADVAAKQSASHTILDFQAGKDLGIGLFGHGASSILDVGVRFAQFTSRSSIKLKENPDWQFKTHVFTFSTAYDRYGYFYSVYNKRQSAYQPFHSFAGSLQASRSFNGLGPSISWSSSEPFVGSPDHGELTFDWGVNAALLFGRQKAKIHHQTTGRYNSGHAAAYAESALTITYQGAPIDRTRSRGVVVPNIGAFAGFSVKYPNAKVSFGYKADFFFGAMDGGIDVRRTEDVGFHGPYASVSIGLP